MSNEELAQMEKIFSVENKRVVVYKGDDESKPLSHEMCQDIDDGTDRCKLNVSSKLYRWGDNWTPNGGAALANAILFEVTEDASLSVKYGLEYSEAFIKYWKGKTDIKEGTIRAWLKNKGVKISVV